MKATMEWCTTDVALDLEGTKLALIEAPTMTAPNKNQAWPKHGIVTKGYIELTADEALKLADELIKAAVAAKDMDLSYVKECLKAKKPEAIIERIDIWGDKR